MSCAALLLLVYYKNISSMQVGADDDGYAVRLKMKHFLGYLQDPKHMQDDSPMYIFDGTFGDRDGSRALLGDYSVPDWFSEDLMKMAGDRRRPPHRSPLLLPCALLVLVPAVIPSHKSFSLTHLGYMACSIHVRRCVWLVDQVI